MSLPVRKRPRPKASGVAIEKTEENGCVIWEVVLNKDEPGDKFGFSFTQAPEVGGSEADNNPTLVVRGLMPEGLMFDWNLEHPDAEVRTGDKILVVNGKTDLNDMKEELSGSALKIKMCRYPPTFDVELKKTEACNRVGMKFCKSDNDSPGSTTKGLLKITEIADDGCMGEYNEAKFSKGEPQFIVAPGMHIEAVNDIMDDPTAMANALRQCPSVCMRIRRRVD